MCHLIDIAVPGDSRVASKENWNVQKYMYQDLAREFRKLWRNISRRFMYTYVGTSVRVELLQKAALLGTAMILQKTLEINANYTCFIQVKQLACKSSASLHCAVNGKNSKNYAFRYMYRYMYFN